VTVSSEPGSLATVTWLTSIRSPKPALKIGGDEELGAGAQRIAVGRENQLLYPDPELRQVDPLTRIRKQNLQYQVTQVVVSTRGIRRSSTADAVRVVEKPFVALSPSELN